MTYSNSQILADYVGYVERGTNQNTTLAPGSHVYPFSFAMPNSAPKLIFHFSYVVASSVDIPWWPDYTTQANIYVVGYTDLNMNPFLVVRYVPMIVMNYTTYIAAF